MKSKRNLGLVILSALSVLLFAVILFLINPFREKPGETLPETKAASVTLKAETTVPETTVPETPEETEAAEPPAATISLAAVGDLLMHESVSGLAKQADGSYDYSYIFDATRDYFRSFDIACINNEVIFGGDDLGIRSYPAFNCLTVMGDAETDAGFDVISAATNHAMDQGTAGVQNCVDYWKNTHPEMTVLGIHGSDEDASQIHVLEREGIRIAFLNYTYGLNGHELPAGRMYMVDMLTNNNSKAIKENIERAREMADFVVVFPHWGIEYKTTPSSGQEEWAEFLAECGADLIIGTHPHVPQPMEWVTAENGNKALVYYSLGNYVSGQYTYATLLGGIALVEITKDAEGTYISGCDMDFLVNQNTVGYTSVRPMFLRDYTDELMAVNACANCTDPEYLSVNAGCDFSTEGLKNLARSIYPDWKE